MAKHEAFENLILQLNAYGVTVDEPFLHGLLVGCATTPSLDRAALVPAIAGEQVLAEVVIESILDTIDRLARDLAEGAFEARFNSRRDRDARRWLAGYFEAVSIHESDWEAHNEMHLKTGHKLVMLHSLRNANFSRGLKMDLPGPGTLKRHPQVISLLVQDIYRSFHPAEIDDEIEPITIGDERLRKMNEGELMELLLGSKDALPFNVVVECASRGDKIVPLLRRHLETERHWQADAADGDFWGLLHALFILGRIPGAASATAQLEGFMRTTAGAHNPLFDWVAGSWPALFRNKQEHTSGPLKQVADDRLLDIFARVAAIECVLAEAVDSNTVEPAIDWLAAMCADETEDAEFRVTAGHSLLDFPRERHRATMLSLLALQTAGSSIENAFDKPEIERAFDVGDNPEWRAFDNPWKFYDPDSIRRRQIRWREEAESYDEFDMFEPETELWSTGGTFAREHPKVGRNDPCPCGSGKKYKKCCMRRH